MTLLRDALTSSGQAKTSEVQTLAYQVHTILTDSGIQFAEQPRNRNTTYSRPMRFDMI